MRCGKALGRIVRKLQPLQETVDQLTQPLSESSTGTPGKIIHQIENWTSREDKLTRARVATVKGRVERCTACELRETCSRPVSMTAGQSRSEVVMIGEAPGKMEDEKGAPFVGPAGKLLRSMLPGYGEEFTWLNVVSCRPPENRTPTKTEIASCRQNFVQQLEAVQARYLLLLGGTALQAFRPELKITLHRGYVFTPGGKYIAMAAYHPAAVLRDKGMRALFRQDIGKFIDLIRDGYKMEMRCILCGHNATEWDVDGVGYCWDHYRKKQDDWTKGWSGLGKTAQEKRRIRSGHRSLF